MVKIVFIHLQNVLTVIHLQQLGSSWDGRPFGHNRHGL